MSERPSSRLLELEEALPLLARFRIVREIVFQARLGIAVHGAQLEHANRPAAEAAPLLGAMSSIR